MVELCPRRRIQRRMLVLRRCIRRLMDRLFMSCLRKTARYRMLPQAMILSPPADASVAPAADAGFESASPPPDAPGYLDADSDLVPLKISLLGDCNIGKTSFLVKYVGDEKGKGEGLENGLNSIDKTLVVGGARISYSIWEVGGDSKSQDHIPIACKDSVAILFMFDLTSRCTLNSVIGWYQEARKWNQTAIPVLIGTKFDDFIQLPIDLQWTIASQVGKSDLAWCIMCNRQGRMRRPSMQHCSFLVQPTTLMSTRCSNSSRPRSSTCHGLWSAISPLANRLSISSLFILCIERTFPISGEVIKSYFRICFL